MGYSPRGHKESDMTEQLHFLSFTVFVVQLVKNPPAVWETWVRFLGWEDLLEKGKATHSIFFPGEFHGQRNLLGYSPWGCKELDMTE